MRLLRELVPHRGWRSPGAVSGGEGLGVYGVPVSFDAPRIGSIAVMHKQPTKKIQSTTSSGYHVAFFVGGTSHAPILLGGNQGNKVCRRSFAGWELKALRWPS